MILMTFVEAQLYLECVIIRITVLRVNICPNSDKSGHYL